MFNVKVDKLNIRFSFSHIRGIGKHVNVSDLTHCVLRINEHTFNAVAACSKNDKFNKEIGRKVSLARVLKQAQEKIELSKAVRFCVWERYFQRCIRNEDFVVDMFDGRVQATGVLDPEYMPKAGSDDLVNQA